MLTGFASCQIPASSYKVEDVSQDFSFFLVAVTEEVCQLQRQTAHLKTLGDTLNVVT